MDYELCKKLKDAGFPKEMQESQLTDGEVYFRLPPTLSELIEACGDGFKELLSVDILDDKQFIEAKIRGRWKASMYQRDETIWKNTMFEGSTPEEAVANLWLALQDKE